MNGTHADITERKRTEAVMAARSRLLRMAISHCLTELLQATLDEAETLTGSQVGFYHFVGPDQVTLSLQAWSTNTVQHKCKAEGYKLHYPVNEAGVWVDCIHERRPVVHNDYASLPHRKGMPEGHVQVIRELVVPVMRGDAIVAVLGVGNKPADYDERNIETVASLADFAWDIAEIKRKEEALRASEEKFRGIFENVQELFYEATTDGLILEASPSIEKITKGQYRREDILGKSMFDFYANSEEQEAFLKLLRERGSVTDYEFMLKNRDGSMVPCSISAKTHCDGHGKPVKIIGSLRDVTERKRAEEILAFLAQTSNGTTDEPFFKVLARYLAQSLGMDFVCIDRLEGGGLTARTVAVWCDGQFEDNVTYALKDTPCGDVVGKTVCCFPASVCQFFPRDTVLENLRAESYVGVTLWSHTGQPIGLIAVIARKPLIDRSLAETTLKLVAVRAAGELERQDAEKSLRESEHLLKEAQNIARLGSYVLNIPAGLWKSSDELDKLFGIDEANGRTVEDWKAIIHPEDRATMSDYLMNEVIGKGKSFDKEYRIIRHENQAERWVHGLGKLEFDAKGCPQTMHGTIQDITERKQAEEEKSKLEAQFQQVQKMESVGRLAGGVAHDFNNMLHVILGNVYLALEEIPQWSAARESLEEIGNCAQRSAELTRQLLAFARKQVIIPKVLDINENVEGLLKLLRRLIGENIHLVWIPAADLGPVKLDPSQIDQILTNLCVNARDAIGGAGKITIETANALFDEAYCAKNTGFVPGEYLRLSVSDDGCGMDTETLAQIFEPFFTTKALGRGTGLGLSTVYGIVKQNNGFIHVDSKPGKGTTFNIYLPRQAAQAAPTQVEIAEELPKSSG